MRLGNPTEQQYRETLGNGSLLGIRRDIEQLQSDLERVQGKLARDAIENAISKLRRDADWYQDWMAEASA
ncbi:MAG TPA: hypothetical protein VKP88_07510 [Candidatus Paceibacterota bacterium]|nr:hypothetical protein [Candidatus Paceibacterota bacterium]